MTDSDWTAPNWQEISTTSANWVVQGENHYCSRGHLKGYVEWTGSTILYGVSGIINKDWYVDSVVTGEARINGAVGWAMKQVESMLDGIVAEQVGGAQ